jgi:ElaB/YqjD/DUF883 family membrane-anchored ribosome-binding protein
VTTLPRHGKTGPTWQDRQTALQEDDQMATQSKATDTGADLDALRKDIEALRGDLESLTKNIKSLGEGKIQEASALGAAKIDELQAELERRIDVLREQGRESVATLERTIQEKPLMTLLAAFGAGMLIARLLERR